MNRLRRARRRRALRIAVLLILLAAPASASGSGYLDALQERSRLLDLADDPAWHTLLHYRAPKLGSGVRSVADDPRFFASPTGATDPQAELDATLALFFAAELAGPDVEHPQCRFVARYRWLRERLDFDPTRLPPSACPGFDAWIANFTPERLTLVFPEAFLNNPGSMFGHTLLRVDTAGRGSGADLLAWAINYAAHTGGEGGPLYALKGVAGFYSGYFSVAPYYQKVKEYGDWESRDIWEYELDFRPEEIERLLEHLWELRGVRFDYYYFDENCAYQLLELLEAGRPGLELTRGRPLYLIPADAVRIVTRQKGLVTAVAWRPSAATRLRHAAEELPRAQQEQVLALVEGALDPEDPALDELPDAERAAVLSLAYDHLRHAFLEDRVDENDSRTRAHRLLLARSRIGVRGDAAPGPDSPDTRPDQGHDTARFALGGGWWNDRPYVEARIRPAFHHLLDPEAGYVRGAQIEFLDAALRFYPDEGELRVHELTVLGITSLSPRDRFFHPVSWSFETGLHSRLLERGNDRDLQPELVFRTRGGAGLAWELGPGLVYGLAEAVVDAAPKLDHHYALGLGGRAGFELSLVRDRWKARLFGAALHFAAGDRTTRVSAGVDQRLRLGEHLALELRTSWERGFGKSWVHAGLRWNLYF